ncbi:MAG: glycosyltransferase family 4 protein [Nitrospiraceae bacterium]
MNIALFSEVSAEQVIGGAERVLRQQAVGLRGRGHHVEVISRARPGDPHDQVVIDGILECRYHVKRTHELSFVSSTMKQTITAFERAQRRATIDVAIVYQSLAALGPLLRMSGAPTTWLYMCLSLAHEEFKTRRLPETSGESRLRWAVNAYARRWIERLVMRRCGAVAVLSDFMRKRVIDVHGIADDKIHVIPGAVDQKRFCPTTSRHAVRRALGLPEDRVLLFTVRNLVSRMGLENLIQAIARLEGDDVRPLVLVGGEGPLQVKLEQLIDRHRLSKHVKLLGFVQEDQLPLYYQSADLVVMPTLQLEGFGLVTVEAMACGTPVLATPVAALPEVVKRIDPLLVAEGTDAASLATAIARIIGRFRADPEEARRLSRKSRQLVETVYNWDRHCADLEGLIQDVAMVRARKAA